MVKFGHFAAGTVGMTSKRARSTCHRILRTTMRRRLLPSRNKRFLDEIRLHFPRWLKTTTTQSEGSSPFRRFRGPNPLGRLPRVAQALLLRLPPAHPAHHSSRFHAFSFTSPH